MGVSRPQGIVEHRPQTAVALRDVLQAGGKKVKIAADFVGDSSTGQQADPGGYQFDAQGKSLYQLADAGDGRFCFLWGEGEPRRRTAGLAQEEFDGWIISWII